MCGTFLPSPWTLDLGGRAAVKLMTICAQNPSTLGSTVHSWAAMRSATVWVRDSTPPSVTITGGSAVGGGWQRGVGDVVVATSDNVGIKRIEASLDSSLSSQSISACDYRFVVPCSQGGAALAIKTQLVGDGTHTVHVRALDSADNWSEASRVIYIDNTAPTSAQALFAPQGEGWRQVNEHSLRWTNPPQTGTAPIAGADLELCPAANGQEDHRGCQSSTHATREIHELSGIKVPAEGDWLARLTLRDAAGNSDPRSAQAVHLRVDTTPPSIELLATDPNDPGRIHASAADALSGVRSVEIAIRRRGESTWRALDVAPEPGGFTAYADDALLPAGTYDVRVRAVDAAGNERSVDSGGLGMGLPVRVTTRLAVGEARHVLARRTAGGRRQRRLVLVAPRPTRYGRVIPLGGRLTAPGGNPLANVEVEIDERLGFDGAAWRRIAVVPTSRSGRFRFRALRGPSRMLRFRYAGTSTIRPSVTQVSLEVRASSSLRVSRHRVVNGDEVTFHGRVGGGFLPATGKLIQLQVFSRGHWLTFATPRADPATGLWSNRYRFSATRGLSRYRFRAVVPREAAYPYLSGASRRVRIVVQGL
jgi:hypothetical protein